MPLRPELLREWMHWRKLDAPIGAARSGNSRAPGYAIEVDLDHLRSDVYALGNALLAGTNWNYPLRTDERLGDVRRIREAVAAAGLQSKHQAELDAYLDATAKLLEQISLELPKLRLV